MIDVCIINKGFNIFLPILFDSLRTQTIDKFTVNVCDYGSEELPREIIEKHKSFFKDFAYYEVKSHMQWARNFLFANTSSEFLIYLDADLKLEPSFLEEHLKALEEDKEDVYAYAFSDFCYKRGDRWIKQNTQEYIDKLGTKPFPSYIPIPCWSLIRRKYMVRWDEEFDKLQDWVLWLDIYKKYNRVGKYIPKVLTWHTQSPNYSIGFKLIEQHAYWKDKLVKKFPGYFK